jgi:HAD superfamily hydrolase (TIGR01509 family)
MSIKAVVFDMDGVLIDAKEWHYEALNKALEHFGMFISRYDHVVTFDGLPTRKKLEMLSVEGGLPRGLHSVINDLKQVFTEELIVRLCKPNFQHQMALSRLKHMGLHVAVCSNSIRKTVQLMMEKAGLIDYLDFYLSNQDVTIGKPNPEIYLKAFSMLKLKPEECLILEDNEHGLKAAYASGAHVLKIDSPQDVSMQRILTAIQSTSIHA